MRTTKHRGRPRDESRLPDPNHRTRTYEPDPLLTESAVTVRDDEEEVFDLGFIVDDRGDRRDSLLASWQRLDEMDTDEALETNRRGLKTEEIDRLEWEGVPASEYPTDARVTTVRAEADEDEFAEDNSLVEDPNESPLIDRYGLDEQSEEEDLDDDDAPERVGIRGRAAGVVRGLGTSVPQDIGAGGFSVEANPLALEAARLSYPISSDPLSDAETDARDVDEMETDQEIDRMADEGGTPAEAEPVNVRPVRPSDLRPVDNEELDAPPRPEVGSVPPLDLPKPEMGLPQPVRMPEPGESVPPPGDRRTAKKPSPPKGRSRAR